MDAKAYNKSVDLWADSLFRFVLKNVRNEEESKDIVQTAFETLWVKKDDVCEEKVKSFLFTIAYRRAIDYHRKDKSEFMEVLPDIHTLTIYEQIDTKKLLAQAFDKLNPRDKQLILLKDWEGYNYEEIATITQLNAAQVKVYLHRARKSLKTIIEQLETVRHEN